MDILAVILAGTLGAIVGSFLNVVVLRLNTGRSLNDRSSCQSCGSRLGVIDLFPVLSWIGLLGRCRHCRSRISSQYVLVEALTAFLFVAVFLVSGSILETFFMLVVTCLMIVILAYDVHHKIIPDPMVYVLIALGILLLFIDTASVGFKVPGFLDLATGPILFMLFFILWYWSKGLWLGLGDGKLALAIGLLLGAEGFSALVLAFWIGAVFGLSMMLTEYLLARMYRRTGLSPYYKRFTMKSEVPFAPFLIIGFYAVYLLELDVLSLVLVFPYV